MPSSSSDPRECSLPIPDDATALIGGRFDPFHLGHLHIARWLLDHSPVRKAVFLPNDRHGFKGNAVLDFDHRIELIRKAITGQTTENRNAPSLYPGIECWDADSRQYGSGWTDELMQR
ncbi:MAG: adenylyltransferase/cytidyltransferase family protein, partial [Candidatus Cloacimonetes bacterium]|nr:adenylyltransferase/cytidyltransferase family protein [Candidatus Cloacimonadota bacterium]